MATLTDAEVAELLADPKPLPRNFRRRLQLRRKRNRPSERYAKLDIESESGRRYRLWVKENTRITNNFSVGLLYLPSTGAKVELLRCNGFHQEHRNRIEGTVIAVDTPHIHHRTERYQAVNKPLHYAKVAYEYRDRKSALNFVARNFGFYIEPPNLGRQKTLFPTR